MAPLLVASRMSAPLRVALVYGVAGAAWIWLTDEQLFAGNAPADAWLLSVGKGMLFVLLSSLLIYVLVRREMIGRQRSAAQLEAVLAAAPFGIAAVDDAGRITHWNRAAERLLGRPAAEAIGRDVAEVGLRASAADATGEGAPLDLDVVQADGSTVPVRVFVADLADPAPGRVLLLQDLRPGLQAEAAQRQIQKLDAVARLAGGMAQEFNNILTTVLGHAELLAESLRRDDPRYESVEEVQLAAGRAADLTRQLLVISGRHVARPALLSLGRLIREMVPAAERILGGDIRLDLDLPADAWPVVCDPGQLQQLVVNLLVNARDAMPEGGVLAVGTTNVTLAAPLGDVPAGDYVLLRVRDSGAGMDRATLERLFEPFFTTKRQGAGLGLATVYGTVQKFGARIRVESTPGHGTAFDIYWPRATEPATDEAPAAAEVHGRGGAVLVVEDDRAVRDLAARVLRRSGLHVLEAGSAEEALAILDRGVAFDLVVADIVLPGMSGTELAEHLRASRPDVPVLFTSGNAAGALSHAGDLRAGTAFMEKPYAPADLVRRVHALLGPAAG